MKHKRLVISLLSGGVLGVICIIGGSARAGGWAGNGLYLLAMWYNRVIIGLTVGLGSELVLIKGPANRFLRGAVLGLLVSSAFYLSSGLQDHVAFVAGIVYGVIIEWVVAKLA